MVTIVSQSFFPYEVVVLIITSIVFGLIWTYLYRSLNYKKNIYITKINTKLNKNITTLENKLDKTFRQFPDLFDNYRRLKFLSLSKDQTDQSKSLKLANKMIEREIEFREIDLTYYPVANPLKSLFQYQRLQAYFSSLRYNLDKFRLRDLEKIDKNIELIEPIYKERVKGDL